MNKKSIKTLPYSLDIFLFLHQTPAQPSSLKLPSKPSRQIKSIPPSLKSTRQHFLPSFKMQFTTTVVLALAALGANAHPNGGQGRSTTNNV
jgi:hypothetical protein